MVSIFSFSLFDNNVYNRLLMKWNGLFHFFHNNMNILHSGCGFY